MLNLSLALHARLADDASIRSMVAEYRGAPAIFTSVTVPSDASRPYIIISGSASDIDDGADDVELRSIERDIGCYADNTGSIAFIDELAEAVRASLHGSSFTIGDKRVLVCRCSGPLVAPTDDSVVGRIVTAAFLIN